MEKWDQEKTTLIQSLCKNIGVFDKVLSPTFSIINEYKMKNKSLLYHFDFYRIKTIDELVEIGFDEYVYSNKICFIEWPQIAMKLISRKFIKVKIDINKKSKKKYYNIYELIPFNLISVNFSFVFKGKSLLIIQ